MTAITIGLAGAAVIATAAITFMILLRFGIHHLKRSGSLKGGPKSLCAALAPRILDLRPCPQDDVQRRGPEDHADAGRSSAETAGQAVTLSPASRPSGRRPLNHVGNRWLRRPRASDVPSQHGHMLGKSHKELRDSASLGSRVYAPVSPPGVIAGAVLQAARSSASLTRGRLDRKLCVRHGTVRRWENGTIPLFDVPYGQLRQVAETLNSSGATVGNDLNELLLASQCDMLIIGMLSGEENYAEVPPIDDKSPEGAAADALLRWAAQGAVPAKYAKLAPTTPLIAGPDMTRLADAARELTAGIFGHDLAAYGSALLTHIGALRCSEQTDPDDRAASWDAYDHGP